MNNLIENIKKLRDEADADGLIEHANLAQVFLNMAENIEDLSTDFYANPRVPDFVVGSLDNLLETAEEEIA